MRTINDCTYQEYKDSVHDAFLYLKIDPKNWTAEKVTDYLEDEESYADYPLMGTSKFLCFISVGEYEVRHNILEDRVLLHLAYHIYRYENMGKYRADLTPEEIEEVEDDIAYIKSKIELPEMNSYEDRNWKDK